MPKKTEETHVKPTFTPEQTPTEIVDWLLSNGYDVSSALAFAKAERSWTLMDTPERSFWVSVQEELGRRAGAK